MINILLFIVLSHSLGFSSPCSGKVPISLKLQKDTIYTYDNNISVTKWPKRNETKAKHFTNSFKSIVYPISFDSAGYIAYNVVVSEKNKDLLELVAKAPLKLPVIVDYPFYPVGQVEGSSSGNPVPIKEVECDTIYRVSESENNPFANVYFNKISINKISELEERKVKDKDIKLIRVDSRKDVVLSGNMEGTGTEKISLYLTEDTREIYEEIREFKYEYVTGKEGQKVAEVMTGEYKRRLALKEKYTKANVSFPDLTSKDETVSYYTNGIGLFVPVTLNTAVNTKMYINPTSENSYLDYNFYIQNFPQKQKNYIYPVDKMNIGKNLILDPGVEIVRNPNLKIDYKIPGVIGKNIISKSMISINDKKRIFSLSKPEPGKEIPQRSLLFDLVNGIPVFELNVNGSIAKTTISFDTNEPQISSKLVKQLGLKTIKIAGSKDRPEENIIEKTEIVVTPTDRPYFKTQATVKDFGQGYYDFKLGLDYIKGKELIINYKDGWLLINDAK
ncbi:MAG: hypothetical protein WCQ47_02020 [bacterium]